MKLLIEIRSSPECGCCPCGQAQFAAKKMNIQSVRTEADCKAALAEIERLFDAEPNTPERDCLDVLTTLVEAYEAQHYLIPEPDPGEAIRYFIESRGLMRTDLEPYIGSRARVAEVLNRKRPLSLNMIRRLYSGLGILAEVLVGPYAVAENKPAYTHGRGVSYDQARSYHN